MNDTCSTCKFWEHWRVIMLADDEPKAVGHCVVERPVNEHAVMTIIQGLTAHDFHCDSYIPAVELVTEKVDG